MIARRAALGCAAALAALPALAAQSHPQPALLATCAAFDTLEHGYITAINGELDNMPEGIAALEERERIHDAQGLIFDRVCGQAATTLGSIQGKARSLVLWDEEAIEEDATYFNDPLRASLLRDLIGGAPPTAG